MKKVRGKLLLGILVIVMTISGCGSKEAKSSYERGILTDTTFESKYLNIKFTLPDGYTLMTKEEMDQSIEFTNEIIYKDKDKKIIDYAKAATVYEMMARDSITGLPNIGLAVENLFGKKVTVDKYVEACKKQLSDTGIEYEFGEVKKDVELAGEKYTVLNCEVVYSGVAMSQQVYIRKVGGRMMLITVTYSEDTQDAKDALLGAFETVK